MHNFFKKLGIFIENKRLFVIIVGLILIAASVFGATRLNTGFDNSTFVNPNSQVYKDYSKFTKYFSSDVVVVLVSGDNTSQLLQPGNLHAMEVIEKQMGATPGVISVIDPAFFIKQAVAQQTGTASLPQDEKMIQGIIIDPQTGQIRSQFRSVLPDDNHAIIAITIGGGTITRTTKIYS
jgi:predicted RND superfamily exporter protein